MTTQKSFVAGGSWGVVLALLAGIATGLFFGEYCAPLAAVGDAYIGLLQMAVLPFIVVSLVTNIGRLTPGQARHLLGGAGVVLVVLWALGLFTLFLISFSFPARETGAFFSSSLVEAPEPIDFLELYIPSNPFRAMAQGLVPAVVVFSILLGVALMGMSDKDALLDQLDRLAEGLNRMSRLVARFTLVGVFALAAGAAGTFSIEEFGRLQAYFLAFAVGIVWLGLWLLPGLVAAITPLRRRDVLRAARDPAITAFATGSFFVVLPMLISNLDELLDRLGADRDSTARPQVLVPLAYPLPHLGPILGLIFVPFAAWFYGNPLELAAFPAFLFSGLIACFGKLIVGIPFLLDELGIPSDSMQLFVISGIVAARMNDAMSVLGMIAFVCFTAARMHGLRRIQAPRLLGTVAIGAALLVGLVGGSRELLERTFQDAYGKEEVLDGMQSLIPGVPFRVLEQASPSPFALGLGQSRLDRIRARRVIRVGFNPEKLPFSYFNGKGELVGFDADMAHRLARDLDVSIEFVPFQEGTLAEQLAADHFDIAMSGIPGTVGRSTRMSLSDSYLTVTLALVAGNRTLPWRDPAAIAQQQGLRLAAVSDSFYAERAGELFPNAEIIEIRKERDFFEDADDRFDALVTSAEGGAAWTLVYPHFDVLTSLPRRIRVPYVYPFGGPDKELEEFLEHWIELKRNDGTIDELYDYWILGKGAVRVGPRWSVIRNVLGWVD
ncbi:MAG: cation:dicarboxylate symporter family transporter [Myxococcota bacterium]